MVDQILVPIDGSELSERAAEASLELARKVGALHRLRAEEKGLTFVKDFPADLPLRSGDPHRVAQVLHNLLSSASETIGRLTAEVAARFADYDAARAPGHSGMGTTLSGNPMQFACLRATLAEVVV